MEQPRSWIDRAKQCLKISLLPIPHELNELDWKLTLSEDSQKLAQHISAFGNQSGGGFLIFGLLPSGEIHGIDQKEAPPIIKKLANISREALEPPQTIEHFADTFSGKTVLMIYIPESLQKPVHLRGKGIEFSFLRSGGQTRKMSRQEIANAVLYSRQVRFEELEAFSCDTTEILKLLDHERFFQLLNIPPIESSESVLDQLINHKMVYRQGNAFSITNLGTIAAAKDLSQFPGKESFTVRVIKYKGSSRIEAQTEREFRQGYGVGFQELIRHIMGELPTNEVIKDALRKNVPVYPEITLRELVANALIHRDFSMTGTHPMVEIFSDRIEVVNPGMLLPSVAIERIIDAAPESRNELLAGLMRRMRICEERGSGIDRALFAIEVYGLPPIEFVNGPNMFKAILYSPRSFKQMSSEERLRACYQHCCLKYVSGERMTNPSFRKRLGLKDSQYTLAWRVIDAAIERGLIKPYDSKGKSRKYASYLPSWA